MQTNTNKQTSNLLEERNASSTAALAATTLPPQQRKSVSNTNGAPRTVTPQETLKGNTSATAPTTTTATAAKVPTTVEDLVQVNTTCIKFNQFMPGNILEESLEITNRHTENIVVRVVATCLNKEFDILDEYVYSIR
jgi:hypothetical protein